ncbi:MAG: hypothetical protein DWQ04_08045 [Chloroflexi bacterium]|nr:MAG: hypothetical protein DWQ04_08045 [Chloroflexota bacterium]
MSYLLAFLRIVVGLVFAVSFLGKLRNIDQFTQIITTFKIVPARWNHLTALFFLIGELTVVIFIIVGQHLLSVAFGLAVLLLLVFTTALVFVLARNIQTSCNCFGENENLVSKHDIWRNVSLLACAAGGWIIDYIGQERGFLAWTEYVMLSITAILFVAFITNLKEFTNLFQTA